MGSISWSHNGNLLAIGNSGAVSNVLVYSFTGSALTVTSAVALVGSGAATVYQVQWSPADDFILVGSLLDVGTNAARVYRFLGTGSALSLAASTTSAGNTVTSVQWSPDGKFIAALSDSAGALFIFSLGNTAGTFSLTQTATSAVTLGSSLTTSWSHDGQYISIGGGTSGVYNVQLFSTNMTGATQCIVRDCTVGSTVGDNGAGVGISGSSNNNIFLNNVSGFNDVNYALVSNVYTGGILGNPTALQNISLPPM